MIDMKQGGISVIYFSTPTQVSDLTFDIKILILLKKENPAGTSCKHDQINQTS